tara:strand:+ start:232 stop:618 length:387 start_codon:yes stop_codon:yes gene_type:complete
MAYSFTATKSSTSADGSFLYTVVETDPETASEFTLDVPSAGRVIRWKAYLSDNTDKTMAPIMGESTNPENEEVVMEFKASAPGDGNVDEQPMVSPVYSSGTLYCRSRASDTVSGTVTHKIYFRPLWRR